MQTYYTVYITSLKASKLVRVFGQRTSYTYSTIFCSSLSPTMMVPCRIMYYVCENCLGDTKPTALRKKNADIRYRSIWYPLHFEWVDMEKAKFSWHPHSNTRISMNCSLSKYAYRIQNMKCSFGWTWWNVYLSIVLCYFRKMNAGLMRIWEKCFTFWPTIVK